MAVAAREHFGALFHAGISGCSAIQPHELAGHWRETSDKNILRELLATEEELAGRAVVMSDGKADATAEADRNQF